MKYWKGLSDPVVILITISYPKFTTKLDKYLYNCKSKFCTKFTNVLRAQLSLPPLPLLVTLRPACCSLASRTSLLLLLGSGEKSRSVSGSRRGRPRRPPRPRPPGAPRGAGTGARIGILIMGAGAGAGSGGPSRVMTSLGPGLACGDTPAPGAWGVGPRKLARENN